jgi:hypothetical protein
METKEHKGPAEITTEHHKVQALDEFIKREAERLHIPTLSDVDARLASHGNVLRGISLWFIRTSLAMPCPLSQSSAAPISRVLPLCIVRQAMVVNNKWVLFVVALSMVKRRITANLVPWKQGGIDVSMPLPFNGSGEGLLNPLYSKGVAKYLEDTWLKKAGLWSFAIISLLEIDMGMTIEDSNQLLVGSSDPKSKA